MRVVFESDVELSTYYADVARPVIAGDRVLCAGGTVVEGGAAALMCACDRNSGTVLGMTFLDGFADGTLVATTTPVVLDEERAAQVLVVPEAFVKLIVVNRALQIVEARDLTYDDHTMPDLIALAEGPPDILDLYPTDDGGLLLYASAGGRAWLRRLRADLTPLWSTQEHLAGVTDNIALLDDRVGSLRAVHLESGRELWRGLLTPRQTIASVDAGALLVIENLADTFVARLTSASTGELIAAHTLPGVFWRGSAGARGLCVAFGMERETPAWQLKPYREWRVTSDTIPVRDDLLFCEGSLALLDAQREKPRRLRLALRGAPRATVDDDLVFIRDDTRLIGVRLA